MFKKSEVFLNIRDVKVTEVLVTGKGRDMTGDASGGGRTQTDGRFRAALRDMFAGTVCSGLSITYGLSFAALIFSGPLAPWLSYGIAVTFLSAAAGAAIVAWRSSFPFAIGGPDNATSAVVAALVTALVARIAATAGRIPWARP